MIGIGVDVSDKQFKKELDTIFTLILENHVVNPKDLVFLDFSIKKLGVGAFKIVANNIVSALWISGIIPKNPTAVMDSNTCHVGGRTYKFDKKKKILNSTITK